MSGEKPVIPMVKANAYGHGLVEVAQFLSHEPKLHALGVASWDEAMELRENGVRSLIIVFSGAMPLHKNLLSLCARKEITPVIASLADLKTLIASSFKGPFHLKFNTGMNRLGIEMHDLETVFSLLKKSGKIPEGVMTHLATAENPKHSTSKFQKFQWHVLRARFKNFNPNILTHFANSAAVFQSRFWETETMTDLIRPGISLYGIGPSSEIRAPKLKVALSLQAKVLQVRELTRGDAVGYGSRYQAKTSHSMAVLASGYGDGVHRMHSNQDLTQQAVLGTISMDMAAVRCSPSTRAGDWIELLGSKTNWWKQAHAAGTIPYELLTSLSERVKRIYE